MSSHAPASDPTFPVPRWLHEVFGERQTALGIVAPLAFGIGVASWLLAVHVPSLPLWQEVLVWALVMDIGAGCVANFTAGTNLFYAERPLARWAFIAVHVHLLAVAWLAGLDLGLAAAYWAFTVTSASVVNLLVGRSSQAVVGVLLGVGGALTAPIAWAATPWMAVVTMLFVLKVVLGFAVDHRR